MTICVSLKVNDCLIFASDSASSLSGPKGDITHVYNHGNKVFNLAVGIPVAGMTCGLGNFGSQSISDVVKGIRSKISNRRKNKIRPNNVVIEDIAKLYFDEFSKLYRNLSDVARKNASFEFFVGGYSGKNGDAELWKIVLFGDTYTCECIQDCNVHGLAWSGQPEAITRLINGISGSTTHVLKGIGLAEKDAIAVTAQLAREQQSSIYSPAMPVHDAISLVEFLAETTVKYVKFLPGANIVGGDLDIAAITKFEGFKWIRRKHYYPKTLNESTDHV